MTRIQFHTTKNTSVFDTTRLWLNDPGRKLYITKRKRLLHSSLRFAVNLLKKHGWLLPYETTVKVQETAVTICADKLHNFLLEHSHKLRADYNIHDLHIFMGPEEFYKLTASQTTWPVMLELPYCSGRMNTYAGLRLCVLPWMSGVLFIPKEYLKT